MSAEPGSMLKTVPTGSWGGEHIRLHVTEKGATIEYDCAVGTIDEPLLMDQNGNFKAQGIHVFERGGPIRAGEPPSKKHPAEYHGWTDGNQMHLRVTLPDMGETLGTFSLGLRRPSQLEKCL